MTAVTMAAVTMTTVTMAAVAMTTDIKGCDRMDINSVNNVNGLKLRLLTALERRRSEIQRWEGGKILLITCFTSKKNHPRGRYGMHFWPF